MKRVLVLGAKVPFTSGGQEALVRSLLAELRRRGFEADELTLPFEPFPKEGLLAQAALWRAFDLSSVAGKDVDLVIATKFPTYYARHPRKSVWLVHQHRAIYDLYGTRFSDCGDGPLDEAQRRLLTDGDTVTLGEAAFLSGISGNVVSRLQRFNGLRGEALYPPLPLGNQYREGSFGSHILSVGRLCSIKRVELMVKAMPHVAAGLTLKIVGVPDEPGYLEYLKNEIAKHHLETRVEFLGRVSDQDLLSLYANALAVYYAPRDEDYGYVTLEAFASAKPVLSAVDSGGVLEFVRDEENGLVVEPREEAFAAAINRLHTDRALAARLGRSGRMLVEEAGLLSEGAWDRVIGRLVSPITDNSGMNSFGADGSEVPGRRHG